MHVIDNPTSSIYDRVPGDYLAMEAHAREKTSGWLQGYINKELSGFTNCETVIREGEILEKILAAEKAFDMGTIVIGTHGRTGLAHLLLGSIAEKIIRSVHCPVYVIRHPDRQVDRVATRLRAGDVWFSSGRSWLRPFFDFLTALAVTACDVAPPTAQPVCTSGCPG